MYDVIIIGGGPAGSSAAIYTARGGMKTLVIDKAPNSGALALTHKIANYPGAEGEWAGRDLLERFRRQARSFGAEYIQTTITDVDVESETKTVFTAAGMFQSKAVIVATGAKGRNRMLPGEERLLGKGVSTCATCDGAFFEGRTVAVIGEDEQAAEEAEAVAKFAERVHFIVPRAELNGVGQAPEHPRIVYHYRTRPLEIVGDQRVEAVRIRQPSGEETLLKVDGVFVFLSGSRPATDFLAGQVPLDEDGYMIVDELMQSPVPGVFGAGEVRRMPVKQAVVAAADGAIAAMAADKYVHKRDRVAVQYK